VRQLKEMQANSQRELAGYKRLVFAQSKEAEGEVLELQHQRIFELETQVEVLQGKYGKLVKSSGSDEQTDLVMRCRDLERRLKES
jgi:signal transduction histidine kinase